MILRSFRAISRETRQLDDPRRFFTGHTLACVVELIRDYLTGSVHREDYHMTKAKAILYFNEAWDRLATWGNCDAIGSAEYNRIKEEWLKHFPNLPERVAFICREANRVPSPGGENPRKDQ